MSEVNQPEVSEENKEKKSGFCGCLAFLVYLAGAALIGGGIYFFFSVPPS